MQENYFLWFLILWVSLSQGFAFSSDDRTADSLDLLARKKRVIDTTPNANTRVRLRDAFYVVHIQKNEIFACAGSILASQIILTTKTCVEGHNRYTVLSGTLSKRSGGRSHLVTGILRHPLSNIHLFAHDIALLSINPPITFGANINRPIPILQSNNGQLPPNSLVTVSGYGYTLQNRRRGIACFSPRREPMLADPHELRSILLPTISMQACRERNDEYPLITNEIICTFHEQKYCSPSEHGNPLVYNGHLAGMLVSDGFGREADVFVSVALPLHRNWILLHMSPEHIPRYIPPAVSPPPHRHIHPQECSRVHPCSDDENGA